MVNILNDSLKYYVDISVFQNKIWISSSFGSLAVGQTETHFQAGLFRDPSFRNRLAKFHGDQMGECRYELVSVVHIMIASRLQIISFEGAVAEDPGGNSTQILEPDKLFLKNINDHRVNQFLNIGSNQL